MKVDIFQKQYNIQIQLWAVPSMLFIACILLAILFKPVATPIVFPLIAIAGIIASHIWKWQGVATTSAILLCVMFYLLTTQSTSSWIWTIALTLSTVSTFVTTALCSDEAYYACDILKQEEIDHRQTITHLNEKVQFLQNKLAHENKDLYQQINELQHQLLNREKQQQIYEKKLLAYAEEQKRDEEKLNAYALAHKEYEEKLHAYADQQKDYEEKLRIQKDEQQLYETKQRAYEEKQRASEKLLILARNEVATAHTNHKQLMQEIEKLRAIQTPSAPLSDNSQLLQETQELFQLAKNEIHQLKAQLQQVQEPSEEGTIDLREFRRIEGLYQQLRQQFEEKNEVLNATRRELFIAQEKLLATQKDLEEAELKNENTVVKSLRQQLEEAEYERDILEKQYAVETQHLHELIDSLMTCG